MDIQLYYEEKGEGEPLILLHGNGEDGTYFKNQIEYFSKSYRVIVVDTRGHGKLIGQWRSFLKCKCNSRCVWNTSGIFCSILPR